MAGILSSLKPNSLYRRSVRLLARQSNQTLLFVGVTRNSINFEISSFLKREHTLSIVLELSDM